MLICTVQPGVLVVTIKYLLTTLSLDMSSASVPNNTPAQLCVSDINGFSGVCRTSVDVGPVFGLAKEINVEELTHGEVGHAAHHPQAKFTERNVLKVVGAT